MNAIQSLIQATTHAQRQWRAPQHVNREGAPSYRRSLREQVVQVLVTGTLQDTFYVSGRQLGVEATEVLLKARRECPEFLARALVYARNKGFMKTLPVLGLVVLSGGGSRTKHLFEAAFERVIQIPDDLRAFVALCKAGTIPGRKGLGGVAAHATRRYLAKLSEYHALKYGSRASRDMTLGDIVKMAHPRAEDAAVAQRLGWLVRGDSIMSSSFWLNPQIKALVDLKRTSDLDTQLTFIRDGKLPYEVVVPTVTAMRPEIWEELLKNAPYMNLLRNLVTFHRHGVFRREENVRLAVEKLTNARAIQRSKVLPFRFFDAWQAYLRQTDPDTRIADALRVALETSFQNMPSLGQRRIAIGTDVSGSMNGTVSDKGATRYVDIAGIFTGALMRKVEDRVIPLPFDTRVHLNHGLSTRDDILVTAEKVSGFVGGGTAVGAPIQHLLDRKIPVDVFIGITDNEEWAYGNEYSCRGNFLHLWRDYRSQVAPEARAYLVTIAPYRDAVAPSGEKGVRFIYGWSDHVLRYIVFDLETGLGQIQEIEQMELE